MSKRILSLVLALVMVLGTFGTVFAVEPVVTAEKTVEQKAGEFLKEAEVLQGNDEGELNLDLKLERRDMVVLLSRLMGEEEVASEFPVSEDSPTWEDVRSDDYYLPMLAWGQVNKYFAGKSETVFAPREAITAQDYAVVLLRALEYEVDGTDAWKAALADAKELGILADVEVENETAITRGQMSVMTLNALGVLVKDSTKTLAETLEIELPVPAVPAELEVVSVSANNLKEVDVVFNKQVDADKLDKANFLLGTTAATSVELLADGVTVRAIFTMTNQTKYKLTVKSVLAVDEDEVTDYEIEITVSDFAAPSVESVRVEGNRKVVLTFSEPVNPTQAIILSNYLIDAKLFGASVSVVGREVSLILTSPLTDGVHKIVASAKIEDFAGFKLLANDMEFVVAKDEVKPAVDSIVEASQIKVVVTFTKPVSDSFTVTPAVGTFSGKTTTDNITYTLNFSGALPLSGTEVVLTDVTDFFGNKDTIKINVIPTIDIVRPEVKSITVVEQDELVIEFTKPVTLGGTYTLKTIATTPVTKAVTAAHFINTDVTPNVTVQSKVVLTATGGDLAAGDYTLEILGVSDTTPLANIVIPVVQTVKVSDLTKPVVSGVKLVAPTTTDAGAIYVEFSEKVDAATALDKANYSYILSNVTPVSLGSSHTISLLTDGKTVMIVVPKITGSQTVTSVTIVNVTDLASNKMVATVDTTLSALSGVTPVVSNAKVTGKNTLVVDVTPGINPYTVTASDFIVKAATSPIEDIYVINAVYNDTKNTITLTLNANISNIGQFKDKVITLDVIAQNLANIYGTKIALTTGISIADGIAPTATKLASTTWDDVNDKLEMVVELSENLTTSTSTASAFVVVIDGVLYPVNLTSYVDAVTTVGSEAPAKLTIEVLTATDLVGKVVKVNFFSSANYKDANNNLANFEFSAVVVAK